MNLKLPHGTCFGGADGQIYEAFCPPWYRLDLWMGWWLRDRFWGCWLGHPMREQGVIVVCDCDGDEHELRVLRARVKLPRVMCESEAKSQGNPPASRSIHRR